MRLHTANRHRRKAMFTKVYREAFVYHMARCERLDRKGRLDLIKDSGYVRRMKRRQVRRT